MPKSSNQKLKLIYLMKILLERTDETHSITMPEIIDALAAYDISAERKSLYNDIENLRVYGLDVIGTQEDRTYSYHIGNRQFELAELKLLVDSVQSAKFITAKKSNELIKKIEGFASKYEASQLQRQVFVAGRVKTMNESIYYNVDRIHAAIAENSRITFQYFQWNVDKKMELRHDGEVFPVFTGREHRLDSFFQFFGEFFDFFIPGLLLVLFHGTPPRSGHLSHFRPGNGSRSASPCVSIVPVRFCNFL